MSFLLLQNGDKLLLQDGTSRLLLQVTDSATFQAAWVGDEETLDLAMQKNVAGQKIGCQMVSATDGSAFTGTVTVYVTGDAGTQAIGSVGSGVCTHEGNGYHSYAPSQGETNYDLIAFTFIGSGAVPRSVQVSTSVVLAGVTHTGATIPTVTQTGSVTGAVGSVTGNVGGNVNGNVVGSVGSVAGAVGSVSGSVGSVTGDLGGKVIGGGSGTITGDGVRASSVTGAVGSVTGAVGSVSGAVGSVAGNVSGNVAGDVQGKVIGGGVSSLTGDGVRAASVTGAVGSVTGAVGSVTAGVSISGTLTSLDAIWTKIKSWLRLMSRSDAAVATDEAAALAEINANGGSGAGTYDPTENALQAPVSVTLGPDEIQDIVDGVVAGIGTDGVAISDESLQEIANSVAAVRASVSREPNRGQRLPLVIGDDYLQAQGRSITWELRNATGLVDLTGATVTLYVVANGVMVQSSNSVVSVPTGDTRSGYVEITADDWGSEIQAGEGAYQFAFFKSGKKLTEIAGVAAVQADLRSV